jgi:hypothetical protein
MRFVLPIMTVFVLAGCSQVAESRVRSALMDAGLSEKDADCMAGRMVDRLSIAQLRKLEALEGKKQSLQDYIDAVARVGDAEALAVTASSAALCTTGIAR